MALPDICFGKVLSHLGACFKKLEQELQSGGDNLASLFRELNLDPVYRSLQDFPMPVPHCSQLAELRVRVDNVEKSAQCCAEAVKPFIATVRNFIQGHRFDWDENNYFTVPVYVETFHQPGLVYLRRFNPDERRPRAALWNIEGLTQDGNLLQFNKNYFDEIANVLMGVLYFTEYQRPHVDPVQLRSDHTYKLLFGCGITHGKSHGGAILGLFAICYLYSLLGKNYLNYIAPSPGTVISAEIEPDGKVGGVNHIEEKVECALTEYGPGITVIIPGENRLSNKLESKISKGHLHYVDTAEQLLEKALFSGDSGRNLDHVRRVLFQGLGTPVLESVFLHLREEMTPEEIKKKYITGYGYSVRYTAHPCGVLSRAEQDAQHVFVQYGFEKAAFFEGEDQKELIFLILDGSPQMDAAWNTPKQEDICLMAKGVFEVARRVDFQRSQLECGFLSSIHTFPIHEGMGLEDLNKKLKIERMKLLHRGAFLRPVCETISAQYHQRTKRLCIISDGYVFDYHDSDDEEERIFSAKQWYTLSPSKQTKDRIALCAPDFSFLPDVLDEHFATSRDIFRKISLQFDGEFPLAWKPETGRLTCPAPSQEGDGIDRTNETVGARLTFELEDVMHFRVLVRMPGWKRMKQIKTVGDILRQGVPATFEIKDFIVDGKGKDRFLDLVAKSGSLSHEEFELWKHFETPAWKCPLCGSSHAKLSDIPDSTSIEEIPVFKSLRELKEELKGGYILLQKNSKEWQFFKTGIEVEDIAIVSIDGVPCWAQPDGELKEMTDQGCQFRLEIEDKTFYVLPV